MAFCHILVLMVPIAIKGESFDEFTYARTCNYDREVECLNFMKAQPAGSTTTSGHPVIASFCHPARRPPMTQPSVTEKGSV